MLAPNQPRVRQRHSDGLYQIPGSTFQLGSRGRKIKEREGKQKSLTKKAQRESKIEHKI